MDNMVYCITGVCDCVLKFSSVAVSPAATKKRREQTQKSHSWDAGTMSTIREEEMKDGGCVQRENLDNNCACLPLSFITILRECIQTAKNPHD